MSEKKTSLIYDYYRSLADEPRGTMGQFTRWIGIRTNMGPSAVIDHLKRDSWSPVEREDIMAAIADGRWRQ